MMTSAQSSGSGPPPAWGHLSDTLNIGVHQVVSPDRLADRVSMIDCMYRYAWCFDERQRETLAECFDEDATWQAIVMGESTIGPFVGRDAVVNFMTSFWDDQRDQRRHMITNAMVEDLGPALAMVYTYHLLVSTTVANGVVPVTTGFYRTRMTKTSTGIWKIGELVAGYDVPF